MIYCIDNLRLLCRLFGTVVLVTVQLLAVCHAETVVKKARPVLTIASIEIPPFIYQDKNSQAAGVLVEKATRVANAAGYDVDVLFMPWVRALEEIKNCNVDAIMPTMKIRQRESFIYYPAQPITWFDVGVVATEKANKNIEDWSSLMRSEVFPLSPQILIMRGFTSGEQFESMRRENRFNLQYSLSFDSAMKMLAADRADYFISIKQFSQQWLDQNTEVTNISLLPVVLEKQPIYLGFCNNPEGIAMANLLSQFVDAQTAVPTP